MQNATYVKGFRAATKVPAGAVNPNHNQTTVAVRSNVRAGGMNPQHNQGLMIRSAVRAGGVKQNHSQL